MKKILSYVIVFVLGITITVGASYLYKASDIEFSSTQTDATNVQDALEEIYDNIGMQVEVKKFYIKAYQNYLDETSGKKSISFEMDNPKLIQITASQRSTYWNDEYDSNFDIYDGNIYSTKINSTRIGGFSVLYNGEIDGVDNHTFEYDLDNKKIIYNRTDYYSAGTHYFKVYLYK